MSWPHTARIRRDMLRVLSSSHFSSVVAVAGPSLGCRHAAPHPRFPWRARHYYYLKQISCKHLTTTTTTTCSNWSYPRAAVCLVPLASSRYSQPCSSSSSPLPLSPPSHSSLHTTAWLKEDKSVVEKAVDTLKEKKKITTKAQVQVDVPKPTILQRVWDTVLHYYNGFKLLALEIRVSSRLLIKTVQGKALSRRESKQFRRTVADIFRVVPFSIFIIIPFMEFLLPFYLYLFPSALPSTFQSKSSKDARKKKQLKVKLQMAQFLQDTLEEMALTRDKNEKESVAEFVQFFEKIRMSGEQATTEEILKFSKLFEDELTLDNLSRPQLVALCKLLLLQPIGSSNTLRFQLRLKLRQLKADDLMITKESVESLTVSELQGACQARGMRAIGMPEDRLRSQLSQWLDLHLNKSVPTSLLLLSRALYLPEDVPTSDALKATLSSLPDTIVEEAEVIVADTAGEAVDNKMRLDVIKQQEELIKEEAEERKMDEAAVSTSETPSEEMIDKAPIITTGVDPQSFIYLGSHSNNNISAEELRDLSQAMSSLKSERSLQEEKESLRDLKEDREEYVEDVAELEVECSEDSLHVSKASTRLGRRVDSMIGQIEDTLQRLESDYVKNGKDTIDQVQSDGAQFTITTKELEEALRALRGTSREAKNKSIVAALDEDHDGNINLNEVAEVVEALALEDTDIKQEHMAQVKDLIKKELTLQAERRAKEQADNTIILQNKKN